MSVRLFLVEVVQDSICLYIYFFNGHTLTLGTGDIFLSIYLQTNGHSGILVRTFNLYKWARVNRGTV